MNRKEAESVSKKMLRIDSSVYPDDYGDNYVIRVWIYGGQS